MASRKKYCYSYSVPKKHLVHPFFIFLFILVAVLLIGILLWQDHTDSDPFDDSMKNSSEPSDAAVLPPSDTASESPSVPVSSEKPVSSEPASSEAAASSAAAVSSDTSSDVSSEASASSSASDETAPKAGINPDGVKPEGEYDYSKEVPLSYEAVGEDYFDDACFIGDSITTGIQLYHIMANTDVYAAKGLNLSTITQKQVIRSADGEMLTVLDAFKRDMPKKAYVMFGANDVALWNKITFIDYYGSLIDSLRNANPDCDIYIQSILPVTAKKSKDDQRYSNEKIDGYNEALRKLAETKKVYFVNVRAALENENGEMPGSYSSDGIHIGAKSYERWINYLKNHVGW